MLGKFCDVLDELRTDMDHGKYVDGALQKLADLHLVKTVGSVHRQKSTNHDREIPTVQFWESLWVRKILVP